MPAQTAAMSAGSQDMDNPEEDVEQAEGEDPEYDQDEDFDGDDAEEMEDGEASPGEDDNLDDVDMLVDYTEINTGSFEEFRMTSRYNNSVQDSWKVFVSSCGSWEAAGQQIWSAITESAPVLKPMFTSPKAVAALRFFEGINSLVNSLDDPAALKVKVETLSFGHLSIEATQPRASLVRDAILDLLQMELGEKFDNLCYKGWVMLLNYVGGAMIYIKAHYGERLKLLQESWRLANLGASGEASQLTMRSNELPLEGEEHAVVVERPPETKSESKARNTPSPSSNWRSKKDKKKGKERKDPFQESGEKGETNAASVPTTFPEMFLFNSAVMAFGASVSWMKEVLACFDNLVCNISNPSRFQEECDILVLRLARVATGPINLSDFKSCMLASLRSLLPKTWSTAHEVAWSWLWENAERILLTTMGKPPKWEKAWGKYLHGMSEQQGYDFRAEVYARFFAACPDGQDLFKMSNTYLHLTATKIMSMTLDIYREPVAMTDTISGVGLRHVGYGVPTQFFAPWASTWIGVLGDSTQDQVVVEAMRWSMGLITKSLVRTILEGSTIVMKAINVNSRSAMKKAIACAPRGERCTWMLKVQVGTQAISPLAWAIDSGALAAASTMLKDILTIRADRDSYYFGADEMFTRHPDLVKKLIDNAPALLPELLSGLIWRSRLTHNGLRRVNFYIKHLLIDQEGKLAHTLKWMAKFKDPHIVCHSAMVLLADIVWKRVALPLFLYRKSWFLFTVIVFVIEKGVLLHMEGGEILTIDELRIMTFVLRTFIYVCSMGSLIFSQLRSLVRCLRNKEFVHPLKGVAIPSYLSNWQEVVKLFLVLSLLVMMTTDPILRCLNDSSTEFFDGTCQAGEKFKVFPHSFFSMVAMFLYFLPLVDLAVLSNSVAAYVLVCGFMLSELCLFLLLALVILLMFSSGLGSLVWENPEVNHRSIINLMEDLYDMFLGWHIGEAADLDRAKVVVLLSQWCFLICLVVFLGNMLAAQLSCAYGTIYADVVGYARLKRINIIVESMPQVSEKTWNWFIVNLKLDKKLEFNEGDVGLAGGIATTEPASAHPTNIDSIRRYGGSTSSQMQWPDESDVEEECDVYERIEKVVNKHLKRLEKNKRSGASRMGSSGMASSMGHEAEDSDD